MGKGSGGGNKHPTRVALLTVRACFVGRIVQRFDVGHAEDLHVPAEGNCLDPVFGFTALERPHTRAEPNEELRGLHAGEAGGDKVPKFVQKNHYPEGKCHDQSARIARGHRPRHQSKRHDPRSKRVHPSRFSRTPVRVSRTPVRVSRALGGFSRARGGVRRINGREIDESFDLFFPQRLDFVTFSG